MYQKTSNKKKLIFNDGKKTNMRILEGITIDDILSQHMDAYIGGLAFNNYVPAHIGRDVKDYLIRLYTLV